MVKLGNCDCEQVSVCRRDSAVRSFINAEKEDHVILQASANSEILPGPDAEGMFPGPGGKHRVSVAGGRYGALTRGLSRK
jgi:hypothetical protein